MAENQERDGEATRAKLLAAAARAFSTRSFAEVGMRDIADAAGVNAALPNRYFGSKAQLFRAAVLPHLNLDAMLEQPRSALSDHLHAYLSALNEGTAEVDAFRAVALAQADPGLRHDINAALEWRVIAPLARFIGGAGGHHRACLIASLFLGHGQMRALSSVEGDALGRAALIGETVEQIAALTSPDIR